MDNICGICTSIISPNEPFCLICGTKTENFKSYCNYCQSELKGDSQVCKICHKSNQSGELSTFPVSEYNPVVSDLSSVSNTTSATSKGLHPPLVIGAGAVALIILCLIGVVIFSNINTGMGISNSVSSNGSATSSSFLSSQNNSSLVGQEGHLSTNLNLRAAPNKTALSVGIHFQNAKVKVLAVESYDTSDGRANWYKVRIITYGCDAVGQLGCGKNSTNDSDEGWVNGKYVNLN